MRSWGLIVWSICKGLVARWYQASAGGWTRRQDLDEGRRALMVCIVSQRFMIAWD
jgi:hypothetical protein